MTTGATATGLSPTTPARLAAQAARCRAQMEMAQRACVEAQHQRKDAHRRRDQARRRAGERILPMWAARRACYDSRGPIVAMWAGDRSPGDDGPEPAAEESLAHPWTALAEGIVNRLFAISLVITSARSTVSGARAERLDDAVDMLDLLIRDVRRSVWHDMTCESSNLLHRPDTVPPMVDGLAAGGIEVPPPAGETAEPA